MDVTQTIDISAPADEVWAILDEQFGSISSWAARMLDSRSDPALGELGGRHVITVEYGPATETLYARDAEGRMLGYRVTGPELPEPISDVRTEWRLTPGDGAGRSRVEIRFVAVVTPPEMEPMLEELLRAGMTPLLEELRHYAETGEAHPNKQRVAA